MGLLEIAGIIAIVIVAFLILWLIFDDSGFAIEMIAWFFD